MVRIPFENHPLLKNGYAPIKICLLLNRIVSRLLDESLQYNVFRSLKYVIHENFFIEFWEVFEVLYIIVAIKNKF